MNDEVVLQARRTNAQPRRGPEIDELMQQRGRRISKGTANIVLSAVVTLAMCAAPQHALFVPDGPRLLPVDGGAENPSFTEFRNRLRRAAQERDLTFVMSVLDPEVYVSFGLQAKGVAAFNEVWQPEGAGSTFWSELESVLGLGATGGNGEFWAPYVYSRWPQEFDPFDHAAVIADEVLLLRSPKEDAPAVARLSYHIVRLLDPRVQDPSTGSSWQRVALPAGAVGYVPSSAIRSPLDVRVEFEEKEGRWLITTFIAGD